MNGLTKHSSTGAWRKRIKAALLLSLAALILVSCYIPRNGFYENKHGIRYYDNDVYRRGWHEIDGVRRYFSYEDGYMLTKSTAIYGVWYGFAPDGGLAEGFLTDEDGVRYYIKGKYQTGWQSIEGRDYYFYLESGIMAKGQVSISGVEYTFSEEGVLIHEEDEINE